MRIYCEEKKGRELSLGGEREREEWFGVDKSVSSYIRYTSGIYSQNTKTPEIPAYP